MDIDTELDVAIAAKSAPVGVEDKAQEMFTEQADKLAAPWERQWEPTKALWRRRAEEALAQQPAAVDDVRIPRELAERVQDALGRFTGDEGWGMDDMDTADDLSAALAAQPAASPLAAIRRTPEYALEKARLEGYAEGRADAQARVEVTDEMVRRAEQAREDTIRKVTAYGSAGIEERYLMAMRAALLTLLENNSDR